MKNKWIVFGTLLGVAVGAGIIYFGIKRYKELNNKPITLTKLKRILKK